MKLDIDDMTIHRFQNRACIRIHIGDSMYLDTPFTTLDNAEIILKNLKQRINNNGI